LETLISIDRELGVLVAELEKAGAMPGTSVLVTTDHGFTGRFHVSRSDSNVDTWIATLNLTLRKDAYAKLLDVTPTILDYFGVALDSITPPLEGRSLLATGNLPTTTTTTTTSAAPVTTTVTATTTTTSP
jgi:arylsulfatase A-like enzyme